MTQATSISTGRDKGQRRTVSAKLDLANAYVNVFTTGTATEDERTVVLGHLAEISGYYRVQGPGLTHDDRAYYEGARSVFGVILSHLRMTPDEREALETAVRHEMFVTMVEGEV